MIYFSEKLRTKNSLEVWKNSSTGGTVAVRISTPDRESASPHLPPNFAAVGQLFCHATSDRGVFWYKKNKNQKSLPKLFLARKQFEAIKNPC